MTVKCAMDIPGSTSGQDFWFWCFYSYEIDHLEELEELSSDQYSSSEDIPRNLFKEKILLLSFILWLVKKIVIQKNTIRCKLLQIIFVGLKLNLNLTPGSSKL